MVVNSYVPFLAIYNYNNSIFDNATFPNGIEKEQAIKSIVKNCAEYPVVYADPQYFIDTIPIWCNEHFYKWKTLYNTTNLEYDPIENYNRYEDWNDKETSIGNIKGNSSGSGSTIRGVRGFDNNNIVNSTQDTVQDSTQNNTESSGNNTANHSGHMHGNIGVTTTQKMMQEEREIADFSIYKTIADDFAKEFCILIL